MEPAGQMVGVRSKGPNRSPTSAYESQRHTETNAKDSSIRFQFTQVTLTHSARLHQGQTAKSACLVNAWSKNTRD